MIKKPPFQYWQGNYHPRDWFTILIVNGVSPKVPNLLGYPGVYVWCTEEGIPLYVGESKNIKKRLSQHIRHDMKNDGQMLFQGIPMKSRIISCLWRDSIYNRLDIEKHIISTYKPKYNIGRHGIWRPE